MTNKRLGGLVTLLVVGAVCAPAQAAPRPWSPSGAGVSARIPEGWHVYARPITSVSSPVQQLVVTSFAVDQTRPDTGCRPTTVLRQMPDTGALLFMFEYRGPTRHDIAKTPPRPQRFSLDPQRLGSYECMGRSYLIRFRDHGRVFQAHVYLGAKASTATRDKVLGTLDSLAIQSLTPKAAAVWTQPERLLARAPTLGVSCPQANHFACDRVGLAVWLRHSAVSVSATIDGRTFSLADPQWSGPRHDGRRKMLAGFLHPAGLLHGALKITADDGPDRWVGRNPVKAGVELLIETTRRHYTRTSLVVPLAPGWG